MTKWVNEMQVHKSILQYHTQTVVVRSEILTTKLKHVDTCKACRDLDHKNSYNLEDGMRITADWMRRAYSVSES